MNCELHLNGKLDDCIYVEYPRCEDVLFHNCIHDNLDLDVIALYFFKIMQILKQMKFEYQNFMVHQISATGKICGLTTSEFQEKLECHLKDYKVHLGLDRLRIVIETRGGFSEGHFGTEAFSNIQNSEELMNKIINTQRDIIVESNDRFFDFSEQRKESSDVNKNSSNDCENKDLSTQAFSRLNREIKDIKDKPINNIDAYPLTPNLEEWEARIIINKDTMSEEISFWVKLVFSDEYPKKAPYVQFLDKIFHPNVYKNRTIRVELLQNLWSPTYGIKTILVCLESLLYHPNLSLPANLTAAKLFTENPEEYEKKFIKSTTIMWCDHEVHNKSDSEYVEPWIDDENKRGSECVEPRTDDGNKLDSDYEELKIDDGSKSDLHYVQ